MSLSWQVHLAEELDGLLQLVRLLPHLRERPGRIEPVEPGRGGAALHLPRLQERRKRLGDVVEDPLAPFLLALQLLPAALDRAGRRQLGVAEDVRVPPHELGVDPSRDPGEVAGAALLEQEREEDRLEEEVSELVDELGVVAGHGRVGYLVRLLDRVRDDRPLRLRAVPGAVAPQPLGELLEIDERPLEPVPAAHEAIRRSRRVSVSPVVVSASGGGSKPGA